MIVHPRHNQRVQVWYRKSFADHMPLHGRIGIVRIVGKGPGPRNHGVEIDGQIYGVPCGNIRNPDSNETYEKEIGNV